MTIQQFSAAKKHFWDEISVLITRFEQTPLSRIDEKEIQRLSFLYRLLCSDLAFARTHFGEQPVAYFLNELVGRSHPYLYQRKGFRWQDIRNFFTYEYPALCRKHGGLFSIVAVVFVVISLMGAAMSFLVPELEQVFLSPEMIAGLREGRLWTESIFAIVPSSVASARILTNNVSVTFLAFALGITVVGTLYILLLNGFLLGLILGVCYKYNMITAILSFVTPHGFIEITAILFSGTAGLLVGQAWMDPGEFSRREVLKEKSAEGVRLVVGMAPVLVLAGLVEGFFSPRADFALPVKLSVGLSLELLLLLYCFRKNPKSEARNPK